MREPVLRSAQHFQFLDGMRGLAALMVVMFHAGFDFRPNMAAHGYLAVDFFFCLSGFVLSHAYSGKLSGEMGFTDFLLVRIIRLWPMIVFGSLLGAGFEIAQSVTGFGASPPPSTVLIYLAAGILLIPSLWSGPEQFHKHLFPLNGPAWSLFFEMFASVLWALLATRSDIRATLWGTIIVTVIASMAFSGVVVDAGSATIVGTRSEVIGSGFARVFTSFGLGLICYEIYRRSRRSLSVPWGVQACILLACLAVPLSYVDHPLYDLGVVFLVSPWLVLAGAETQLRNTAIIKAAALGGTVSYPLYAVHLPILAAFIGATRPFAPSIPGPIMAVVVTGIALTASMLILRFYDEPIRRWLTAAIGPHRAASKIKTATISKGDQPATALANPISKPSSPPASGVREWSRRD